MNREEQIKKWLDDFKSRPDSFYCDQIHAWMNQERCSALRSAKYPNYCCAYCKKWGTISGYTKKVVKPKREKTGMAPFGYKRIDNTLVVDEEEMAIMARLAGLVDRNYPQKSYQYIADILNEEGFRKRNGKKFEAMNVRNIYKTYQKNLKKKKNS